ncbi:hypothetical protein HZS_8015, partial [Henneguya salminicola]
MAIRPFWDYSMSKEEVENNEEKYFKQFLNILKSQPWKDKLSHFEHNLEAFKILIIPDMATAVANVICIVVDARFPKIDIIPAENVIGWKRYFIQRFPGLKVVIFSSFPKDQNHLISDATKVMSKTRRKKGGFMAYGLKEFLETCACLFPDKSTAINIKTDFEEWKRKIELETLEQFSDSDDLCTGGDKLKDFYSLNKKWEDDYEKKEFLTLGLVGFPNVGKSSFLNGIMGRKVASVSKTPGHTKYFQTIFITNNVVLCDCPGVVFPSIIEKQWQILSGIFPLSQLREPYTSIGYLAERTDLVKILRLKHPSENEDSNEWSAWDICIAWANKRGFFTAKSGRPDVYRAANHLLRLVTIGRIGIYQLPPGFNENKHLFNNDPETVSIRQFLKKYALYSKYKLDCIDSEQSADNISEEENEASFLCPADYKSFDSETTQSCVIKA